MRELTIKRQIDEKYRSYAVYIIESRGIPNWYDSLTNVQRILIDDCPSSFAKTISVVGSAISAGYHHGDCLDFDTLINLGDGTQIKIGEWYEKYKDTEFIVKCVDENNNPIYSCGHSPRIGQTTDEYYEIELENGEIIKCTKNHPFLIGNSYIKAEDLKNGDDIVEY